MRSEQRSPAPDWVPPALAEVYLAGAAAMAAGELDAGHHWDHVERVTKTALRLAREEGAEELVSGAAGLLHDLGRIRPGDHAARSVELARPILAESPLNAEQTRVALDAIADHRFRDGRQPVTLEGKILQDADRLDAIGALGIARCFAKSTAAGRRLYCPEDPFGEARESLDDAGFAVDHFYTKLLKLKDTFHTAAARRLAQRRHEFLVAFLEELREELNGCPSDSSGESD